ncbi:MAG: hypothetical protein IIA90_00600 [Chloroflexi bacterium]|nr:hypothetical protein [Chloroflexota bacterium]
MGTIFRLKPLWPAGAAALAVLLLAGCGSSGNTPTVERDADGLPVARISARYATALADDLDTLVASTDATFVGEGIGTGQSRYVQLGNSRELPLPVSVFLVRIEASTGQPAVGSVVKVEQLGGVTSGGEVRVLLIGDTAISVGSRYLFFARQDGPNTFSASAFARFPIEDGRVTAPVGWETTGASQALAGDTPAEAIERLAAE